jgi:hypothetical protein
VLVRFNLGTRFLPKIDHPGIAMRIRDSHRRKPLATQETTQRRRYPAPSRTKGSP